MDLTILIVAGIILVIGAVLLFIGITAQRKINIEETEYKIDNNKKTYTANDANLNEIFVTLSEMEGGKVNLTIAQIKELARVMNDYTGEDEIYNALKEAWVKKHAG